MSPFWPNQKVEPPKTGAAPEKAPSFQSGLRSFIEAQPYTAVVIALGIGWLFGRTHRSL